MLDSNSVFTCNLKLVLWLINKKDSKVLQGQKEKKEAVKTVIIKKL